MAIMIAYFDETVPTKVLEAAVAQELKESCAPNLLLQVVRETNAIQGRRQSVMFCIGHVASHGEDGLKRVVIL